MNFSFVMGSFLVLTDKSLVLIGENRPMVNPTELPQK